MNKNKHNSILIQIYFNLLDIEEDIYTNSFPIEEIQKRVQKIKDIIHEGLED
jgi:hypothetical protein